MQGCNPIIMPLNTRWPAGFSSPSWWWWCKQATQGTRKSKVVRTCCVLPPLAPLHQNPTNPNKALCTLPPLRPHEKPRSRKLPGKKHNLTISDKNIKLIKIMPKVKCWMLMRKSGGVILFGRHEARYCLVISGWRWYHGMQTSCSQSASFTSNNVAQQSGNGECLFTTISCNPSEYSSGSRSNSSLIFTILTTRMRGEISCR